MSNTFRKAEKFKQDRIDFAKDAYKPVTKMKEKQSLRHEIEESLVEYIPDIDYDCEGALPLKRIGHNAS